MIQMIIINDKRHLKLEHPGQQVMAAVISTMVMMII